MKTIRISTLIVLALFGAGTLHAGNGPGRKGFGPRSGNAASDEAATAALNRLLHVWAHAPAETNPGHDTMLDDLKATVARLNDPLATLAGVTLDRAA